MFSCFFYDLVYAPGFCGGCNILIKSPVLITSACANDGGRVGKHTDSEDGAVLHNFHRRNGEIDHA